MLQAKHRRQSSKMENEIKTKQTNKGSKQTLKQDNKHAN